MTLKQYLKYKELSQTEAAKQLDLPVLSVNRYCIGSRMPSIAIVVRIEKWSKGRVKAKDWVDE